MTDFNYTVDQAVAFAASRAARDWLNFSIEQRNRASVIQNIPAYLIWDAACDKIRMLEVILPPPETCH